MHGFDPDASRGVDGIERAGSAAEAVARSDLVLSVNAAAVAVAVARDARPALGASAVYADLNTAAPALKRTLAEEVGVAFADVALLGPVPAGGLATRALASGEGAAAFASVVGPLGMPVEVVSKRPGDAAARKLLRSVFMKGLAASALESLEAARAAGDAVWLESELAGVLGPALLERLLEGSRAHAARRVEEMEAARELLTSLGVEPRIAGASADVLRALRVAQ